VARTIKKECGPITVTESLRIDGSLTLEPGVVLKFQPDTELIVGYHGAAKLIVKGGEAPDQRVVMTSAGDQAAGVWKGINLEAGADRSQITGLDLDYAGDAGGAAIRMQDTSDVTLSKTRIRHAKEHALVTRGKVSFAEFAGNQIEDAGKLALSLEPSTVGTLGTSNTFSPDAVIEIRGGTVDADATWKNAGAPYQVTETVQVQNQTGATLTISDATLAFMSDAQLMIGYSLRGKLKIVGPAVLTGVDGKPGSWPGIDIGDTGEAMIENATLSNGGAADRGVLTVQSGGKLTLGEVTFKDNKVGLWAADRSSLTASKPLTFRGNERAAHLSATGLGALAAANVYGDGQIIDVVGGALHADTTWLSQAKASVQLLGNVDVDGSFTLTIRGGTYQWKPDTGMRIGYSAPGSLKIVGKANAPVTFTSLLEGEAWKGIDLSDHARAIELTYLDLADASGDAGVLARPNVAGKLDHVTCARCAATFAPACGAKLETSATVAAGPQTKLAIKKPTGC
ncbi:MAG TPA: hypothetical protein VNO30_44550, partial [Kofleriaceae bacterium]|nr:hypothetical protein [Kofleriaceae bacterium]